MASPTDAQVRSAAIHAALGDPVRVAIVDELAATDRSPIELSRLLGVAPNLLAFHLDTLERASLIERVVSSGDRRRRYIRLRVDHLSLVAPHVDDDPGPIVFVCTHNSARSQLAAAAWRADRGGDATSAGTDPADAVHPGTVAAATRSGLDLGDPTPRRLERIPSTGTLVTVCDLAHEQLGPTTGWHWSIPDPATEGTAAAFDRALHLIRAHIRAVTPQEYR